MNTRGFGRRSWLGYCLLAVILLGCFVLFNRADDNSATMAPNLVFNR
jgi:hypothetical protein